MGQPVISSSQMLQWVKSDFADTYKRQVASLEPRLSTIMNLSVPSSKLIEHYGYYLAAPHMKIWRNGETISSKAFSSVSFSVQNYNWGIRVEWNENDRRFDQTQTIRDRAADAGRSAAMLKERAAFQILTGATDNDLLPAVPNAPDGVGFFSATDGSGANRFGVSSGNLLAGSGVASPTAIRTDFWNAVEQFKLFQDGEGQPYWEPSMLDSTGFTIICGAANEQVFREAFAQRVTQGSAAATNSVSNIILDAGVSVDIWTTQRISDNDWFVFVKNAPKKALFCQVAKEPEEKWATMDNSDSVRDSRQEYYQVDSIYGFGLSLPVSAMKVNN